MCDQVPKIAETSNGRRLKMKHQEETLLKRVTTDVDKQRCALSLRLPGQHHHACTKVGLTQVEVTVPLSFLSLHCLSIIEQRQLNFPLGFHAFN